MGITESDDLPLLQFSSSSDNSATKRTGTIWTAVAHIITGVIGSGVLSLAWSMAQLGWIAGPFLMLFFAFITLVSTFLLCDCYRSPDPEYGPIRNRSYTDAVRLYLGDGVVQGSIDGLSASSGTQKLWLVSQALGDIAFAYPYSMIVLNIQDTLRSPPPESETMKQASVVSVCITTFFYLSCGGFGYAAFGDQTPGNLLTGFGFYEPYWLIDFANACIVLHLVGGYQVYSQPVFAVADKWFAERLPDSTFVHKHYTLKLPILPALELNVQRVCFRTAYVVSTTAVAMMFPYFNQVLGVLGALNFWPLSIYFPVEMWLRQRNIRGWTPTWILLRSFSILCFVLTMFALVGSIQGLVAARFS
ncbi:UNVERIFIED_CONTAM: putative amino acid permease 7 [Sesamum radiatum]|uniref:Amino acid permease 7 n=1 Tax=Sesamum radiatum TaxID=300843 RepID=A0AAW2K4A2_SESRA